MDGSKGRSGRVWKFPPPSHAGIPSLDLLGRSDCAIPTHAAYMLTFSNLFPKLEYDIFGYPKWNT